MLSVARWWPEKLCPIGWQVVDNSLKMADLTDLSARLQVRDTKKQAVEQTERLRLVVERLGPRQQAALAKRAGLHPQSLTRYLKGGRQPRTEKLAAIAHAAGVSLGWLLTGDGDMVTPSKDVLTLHSAGFGDRSDLDNAPAGVSYIPIPRFDVTVSAGAGALTHEHPQVVEYFSYAEDFLRLRLRRHASDLGLVEARGDSMEPTLRDGDILTVDIRPDQPLENGLLYVIANGDALVVKRVELRFNSVVLHSDNTRYTPETFDREAAEQLHVVGQVLLVSAPPR